MLNTCSDMFYEKVHMWLQTDASLRVSCKPHHAHNHAVVTCIVCDM